jgi:hypothetical protein
MALKLTARIADDFAWLDGPLSYAAMTTSGRKQPLASPDIASGECPLFPNTSHSDVNI